MTNSRIVLLAMFAVVVSSGVETAFANPVYSFTTIDVPGTGFGTSPSGINDSGQIVGLFPSSVGTRGFLYTGGSFTTINVPAATNTYAYGINDSGQIVGAFFDSTGRRHGFLDTGGSFTTIDVPGAMMGPFGTEAFGINDSTQIVGTFQDATGIHGFVDTGGSFITHPGLLWGRVLAPHPPGSTTAVRS